MRWALYGAITSAIDWAPTGTGNGVLTSAVHVALHSPVIGAKKWRHSSAQEWQAVCHPSARWQWA